MELINGAANYVKSEKPLFLALGNFDGVHLGHQEIINQVVRTARQNNGLAAAFIFEPHPIKVISPEKAPKLLLTAARKAQMMKELGLDILIYQEFTREVSCWTPDHFAGEILSDQLDAAQVFVGFNYSFGYRGQGSPELLEKLGAELGFAVKVIEPVEVKGHLVSSSLIRKLLMDGDIQNARVLLGSEPMIEARIIKGENRGASIGFPTANLEINPDLIIPGIGVYAGRIIIKNQAYRCVVNIGRKPTFHDEYPLTAEAHIIEFAGDVYGEEIELFFISKIRDERKFSGIDELVGQIARDIDQALKI